jgi:hypothetical protein
MDLLTNSSVPRRIIVIRIFRRISALVMKRDTILIILRSGQTRTTCQGLLHLGPRARATSEVSISANRCKSGGSGSEVVVRNGGQR